MTSDLEIRPSAPQATAGIPVREIGEKLVNVCRYSPRGIIADPARDVTGQIIYVREDVAYRLAWVSFRLHKRGRRLRVLGGFSNREGCDTGGAITVTLATLDGSPVLMDEGSRSLLREALMNQGFAPGKQWWRFSCGDQAWAEYYGADEVRYGSTWLQPEA